MRGWDIIGLAIVLVVAGFSDCLAETKQITAEATYTMGDGESPSFAEAQVLQKAKQAALEQAGTYVEAYTKMQNYDLTADEIQTLAGGVLAVEVLDKTRTLVGDGLRFYTKIKATVTTDMMEELAQRIKGKNLVQEYTKLQSEYARLNEELETWKVLVGKMPYGPDRDAALDRIREQEKSVGLVHKKEAALFQRLISGEQLIASALNEQAEIDQLLTFIKERGHLIEVENLRALPVVGTGNSLMVTVPIRLKHASTLPAVLSDVAQKLGGDKVRGLPSTFNPEERDPIKRFFSFGLSFKNDNLPTLRIFMPNDFKSKLTLRTVPGEPQDYRLDYKHKRGDNKYREAVLSSYYISTSGSKVRLSRSRPIDKYFHKRISDLALQVELSYTDQNFPSERCVVPYLVNRLLPVEEVKSKFDGLTHVDYYVGKTASDTFSVLLLLDETSFDVEFRLSSRLAKKLNRVRAWFDDRQNVSGNVCDTVVRND